MNSESFFGAEIGFESLPGCKWTGCKANASVDEYCVPHLIVSLQRRAEDALRDEREKAKTTARQQAALVAAMVKVILSLIVTKKLKLA